MENLRGLSSVRVNKGFLLEKLRENKDSHRRMFEEALEGWHEEVLKTLKETIKRVKADKQYNPRWYLPMPTDHTADYDRVIELIEASLDEEFVLSETEFNQFVRDDWGWKADFMNTYVNYSNNAG